jgi:hypothetical protein
MRLAFWLLIAVAFFYAAYSAFLAVSDYFQVAGVVEEALATRNRGRWEDRAVQLKEAVLKGVREAGVPLDENNVSIDEKDRALHVRVQWSHAMLVVRGEHVLAIPIWVERTVASLDGAPAR